MLQQFLMLLLGVVIIVFIVLWWRKIAMAVELEFHMLVLTQEDLYDKYEHDEKGFKEFMTAHGFKNGQEAIQRIVKRSNEVVKDYQRFYKFVPFKKVRLSLAKDIERLEKNTDKFKELQEK